MNALIVATANAFSARRRLFTDRNLFSDRLEKCLLDVPSASRSMTARRLARLRAETMTAIVDAVEARTRRAARAAFLELSGLVLTREASIRAAARAGKSQCLQELVPVVAARFRRREIITRGIPREYRLRTVRRMAVSRRFSLHGDLIARVSEKKEEKRAVRLHALHADAMAEIRLGRVVLRPASATASVVPEAMDDGTAALLAGIILFLPVIILFLLIGRIVMCVDGAARSALIALKPEPKIRRNRSVRRADVLRKRKAQKKNTVRPRRLIF